MYEWVLQQPRMKLYLRKVTVVGQTLGGGGGKGGDQGGMAMFRTDHKWTIAEAAEGHWLMGPEYLCEHPSAVTRGLALGAPSSDCPD